MLDVSWGETFVLIGFGFVLIGRGDLPRASRALGTHVGRVVGLLRGARMRADRFASDNELRRLQNELRSGLRELDRVKTEMAVAATGFGGGFGGGMVVRPSLGSSAAAVGANRRIGEVAVGGVRGGSAATTSAVAGAAGGAEVAAGMRSVLDPLPSSSASTIGVAGGGAIGGAEYLAAARNAAASTESHPSDSTSAAASATYYASLAPRSQSVAAVAEEEWEKRGIGFRSRAEMGTGAWGDGGGGAHGVGGGMRLGAGATGTGGTIGGASLLSDLIQQSLIHDQYDRTVREQDEAMEKRAERMREETRRKAG